MPRKPAVEEEDEGPDKSWMESYADAMTLLLAFFIMLFAFALVDETKFYDFRVGMVTALGVSDPVNEKADNLLESGDGIALTVGLAAVPTEEIRNEIEQKAGDLEETGTVTVDNIEDVVSLLEAKFIENGASEFVTVDVDERGVVIRYDGHVLFASGSAQLGLDANGLLVATSQVLSLVDNPIDIEGHTDDVPTGSGWISNWELSAARASAVVRWILDFGELPPRRLAAVGMSDTRPVASNDTDEGRRQNRRVEVVIRVDGMLESDIDVLDPVGDPIGDPLAAQPEASVNSPDPTQENTDAVGVNGSSQGAERSGIETRDEE